MLHSTEIYLELFKRGVFDPLVTTDGKKHVKQELCLKYLVDNVTKDLGYGGAAGGAKSWTGCTWLAFMSLVYPGTRYFIGRVELKRLRESTLMTFFKVCNHYGIEKDKDWKYNGQDHFIQFVNGSRVDMLELKYLPSDPMYERYGSVEYTSGWLEEAGEVHFKAYDVLKTRVGRCLNDKYGILSKTFSTLNPKKNWCNTVYWKPFKENKLPEDRKFIQALVQDNPFIPQDYIDNLHRITDKVTKQRLLYGNFDYDDEDGSLVTYDKLMDMFTNSFVPKGGQRFLTMDIAITNDKFTCFAWEGMRVIEVRSIKNVAKPVSIQTTEGEWINKVDFTPLLNNITELCTKHAIPRSNTCFDADGIGGKLVKYLPGAVAIHNGMKGIHPEYKNLSTELGFKLAEEINSDNLFFDCNIDPQLKEEIIEEMQASLKRDSEVGEKLALIPKATVKDLISRSPDHYDGLKYRMLFRITRQK